MLLRILQKYVEHSRQRLNAKKKIVMHAKSLLTTILQTPAEHL